MWVGGGGGGWVVIIVSFWANREEISVSSSWLMLLLSRPICSNFLISSQSRATVIGFGSAIVEDEDVEDYCNLSETKDQIS